MLRSFSAENFRNVKAKDLRFERVNLLIGPNNAGKSNLIRAMEFLSVVLNGGPRHPGFLEAVDQFGRGDLLDRALPKPGEIALQWELESPGDTGLSYGLAFRIGESIQWPSGCSIVRETLSRSQPKEGQAKPYEFLNCHGEKPGIGYFSMKDPAGKPRRLKLNVDATDTVFRQMNSLLDQQKDFYSWHFPIFRQVSDTVTQYFDGFRRYSATEFNIENVVTPARIDRSVRYLDYQGTQFVNVLKRISSEHGLEEYEDRLRELIPNLKRLEVVDVSDTQQSVMLNIGGKRFRLHEMSDGSIKAMLMALLFFTPFRMSFLAIDEPEINMHPAWLKVVGRWIQTAKSADQVMICTHSPDLLDVFTETFKEGSTAIFICQTKDPGIKRLDPAEFGAFFDDGWELGDLYRVGEPQLGGWPW